MPYMGFQPTIPASKGAKTVRALDRSATVTGLALLRINKQEIKRQQSVGVISHFCLVLLKSLCR
jgi:hypothetical protein